MTLDYLCKLSKPFVYMDHTIISLHYTVTCMYFIFKVSEFQISHRVSFCLWWRQNTQQIRMGCMRLSATISKMLFTSLNGGNSKIASLSHYAKKREIFNIWVRGPRIYYSVLFSTLNSVECSIYYHETFDDLFGVEISRANYMIRHKEIRMYSSNINYLGIQFHIELPK